MYSKSIHSDLRRVDRARGEYLSRAIAIERELDDVVCAYFDIEPFQAAEMRAWILSRLSLGAKVGLIREIATSIDGGHLSRFQGLVAALDRMVAERNRQAHEMYDVMRITDTEGRWADGIVR